MGGADYCWVEERVKQTYKGGSGVKRKNYIIGEEKEKIWVRISTIPLHSTILRAERMDIIVEEKGVKIGKDALLVTLGPVRTVDVLATKKQLQFYL